MAQCSGLVRRACPFLIPLATRSLAASSALHHHNRLFGSQFPPFSTSSADGPSLETSGRSRPVAYHSIGDKIENEISSYSNDVVSLPSGSFLFRRASSLIPLATYSYGSLSFSGHCHNRLFASWFLPFSTSSANNSSRPVTEFRNPKQNASETSESPCLLDGLAFDSIEDYPEDGTLTLSRKTEDEIIEIQVTEDNKVEVEFVDVQRLRMCIKILYRDNFKKCMEVDVTFPPLYIQQVLMSVDGDPKGERQVHVDEFEGILDKREINRSNLDFIFKYIEKRMENWRLTAAKY